MMVCFIANEWFKIQKQINRAVNVYTATWECNYFFLNKLLIFYTLLHEKMYITCTSCMYLAIDFQISV